MPDRTRPLAFPSEVERAVLDAGLYDMQLAHGAGLIADSSRFDILFAPENVEASERNVRGVTTIALSGTGEATFRTATFGISDRAHIAQVDMLGSNKVIDLGVQADKAPRFSKIANSTFTRKALFELYRERGLCTLGGAVVVEGDQENTVMALPFAASAVLNHLAETTGSKAAKVGSFIHRLRSEESRERQQKFKEGLGPDPKKLAAVGTFMLLISGAVQRPGGPVVVERPFTASI